MIKHYLKTTFRYLAEHQIFSAINLIGLTTALCVAYYALLFVRFESSYDKFNTKAGRIYLISADVETAAGVNFETSPGPLAGAFQSSFPEIETVTKIFLDYYIVQKDKMSFGEQMLAYADPSVFSVFSFNLIRGNPATVFNAPYTMVLSETAARKFFGTDDCLNKTLTLDGKIPVTIRGVMKDIPMNSHFRTDIFLSMSSLVQEGTIWTRSWSHFGFSTYLLLAESANAGQLAKKLTGFVKEHPLPNNLRYNLSLEPLPGLYLHGKARGNKAGGTATGNYKNIYIFSIVAIFVLFIAGFNFINLTTAFSLKRAKEIGVRKVMGATKTQLISQFLMDAVMLSLLAFIAAVLLCVLLLPWFNGLTGKTVRTGVFDNLSYFCLFFLLTMLVGLIAGIYPAFFLSGFQPITNLKGRFANGAKGSFLRKALVVVQFTLAVVLIVATIVVYRQLNFMQNENLGFKKEHNLVIDFHYDERIINHEEAVAAQLTAIPGIRLTSLSSCIPGRPNKKFPTVIEKNNERQELQSDAYFVDYNFLEQYGIDIIAGRGFSKEFPSDVKRGIVINEAAVKILGFANPESAVGKRFWQRGDSGIIIGVMRDFHFHSLHEQIKPLTMQVAPGFFTFLTLSVSSDDIRATIKNVERKWADIVPGLPLIYFFADETFNAQYAAEDRFGKLFICFAALAIIISCLGLVGLTSFDTARRTKEIGIRKILGASSTGIITLITKDFAGLVFIATLIASPLAWTGMHYWLNDFAYRVPVRVVYFLTAGALAMAIALFTVSFQAVKAAMANPVKSLRTE